MDLGNQLILIGAGLIFMSIFAGLISSRIGAPLLLVFLALGMLAGEDGILGLRFQDFQAAYTIGAIALAIILFDGGLRTRRETLRLASWPALALATIGVVVTAGLTGIVAKWLFGVSWLEGLLIGSIVASTDAAAVFFLLHLRGTNLVKRVSATLEAESGLNDPMAVFLTVTLVQLLLNGVPAADLQSISGFAALFAYQMAGGAAIGLAGGFLLATLINKVQLSPGLYPILALSSALLVFAATQNLGASGFLAVYLAGVVLGNRRHRATQIIDRFQDGMAWLSQIVMFLMLGLLVSPSSLIESLVPALALSAFLILIARPAAVVLCLLPFRFTWRERTFVSWVGLRGAVPIFLGTVPVLAGVPNPELFFNVAFAIVLTSLIVQGWTINLAAKRLNLALPPVPEAPKRIDVDLPDNLGRDLAALSVDEESFAVGRRIGELPLTGDVEIVSVVRDGRMHAAKSVSSLLANDYVLAIGPPESLESLDAVFGRSPRRDPKGRDTEALGEFAFDGVTPVGRVADLYGIPIPTGERDLSLNMFLRRYFGRTPLRGDRLHVGGVEFVARKVDDDRVTQVGIELDPRPLSPFDRDTLAIWLRAVRHRVRAAIAGTLARIRSPGKAAGRDGTRSAHDDGPRPRDAKELKTSKNDTSAG